MIAELEARIERLQKRVAARRYRARRGTKTGLPRFSPTWLAKHRARLGLSAADYGRLVGVSAITIYNWEKGRTRPRPRQLEGLARVRALGRREATERLRSRED